MLLHTGKKTLSLLPLEKLIHLLVINVHQLIFFKDRLVGLDRLELWRMRA